ncbi:hypothetical protein FH972_011448 [Carpinus fangiana]|uniref:SOSEKI DIX-like domain-containing protein n=1 Tax=Carpinus fangiana TaxID=176857 RepID=A0A660KT83_9ROSI|nr:hypothetical protein FH972_011448 [Carpinus fangiana]
MAVASRGRSAAELQVPTKWRDREASPERTKVWTEPKLKPAEKRSVPVVYYLSRNGQLEHPHFMEVPLSSPEGLYLRDVINRLNLLRGKGMASVYSWSSKRSYRNGFVWHDLAENDFIYPAHGQEYVLKGSELLDPCLNRKLHETASSRSLRPPEMDKSGEDPDYPLITRRRNQSWSSIDLNEYKVYKAESSGESSGKAAADASTQTDDKRRRRRPVREKEQAEEEEEEKGQQEMCQSQSTELSRDEISPPPSDSSPETLESLMKADGRLVLGSTGANEDNSNRAVEICPSGRMKASSVLMQLISCGSMTFKDCGPTSAKDERFSLVGHYKSRLPRGAANNQAGTSSRISSFSGLKLEDKEYFSGSLVETNKKEEVPSLKRSSSYNADRSSQLHLSEGEAEGGASTKCIPRKSKTAPAKKDGNIDGSCMASGGSGGSKRLDA